MDLCDFLLFFVLFSIHVFNTEARICWRNPYCSCYTDDQKVSIYCTKVTDVAHVTELFKKYAFLNIVNLRGNFTTLPTGAFYGISVNMLSMTAPLQVNIPPDSLSGVRDLQSIRLNQTDFLSIPDVFCNRKELKSFRLVRGKLTSLDTELQNMSSVTEIIMSKNRISRVSQHAFLGSTKILKLDLSENEIDYIHPETFLPMRFLAEVYLDHNKLYTVDGCFRTLNPKTIDLYVNNLTSVENVFHQGMWNLRYLNLGGNPKLRLTSDTFNSSLKSLIELHLSNNGMSEFEHSTLRNLWNLHYLYLNGNNLSSVSRYFLEYTPYVTTLELSNNRLKTVEGMLEDVKVPFNSLKLTLDGNELTTVSVGRTHISIYYLDMSRNRISGIRAEDTAYLKNIVTFNLSRNSINFLEERCFIGFHSLQYLDLSYNHLANLNGTLQGLPNLIKLYLSSVSLETLSEEEIAGCQRLKTIVLGNNSLSSVYRVFQDMKYIVMLDVSANNLTTLTADSFSPTRSAKVRVNQLRMANNSWACDCRLSWFANWKKRRSSKLLDEPVCSTPLHLQGLPMRDLNLTDFETWLDDCPESCECLCRVEGLEMHTEVRCLRKGLKEIPKLLPSNVRKLNLRGNVIESFDGHDILGYQELEHLNLENNAVAQVQLAFPPKMFSLRLASNNLRTFPLEKLVNNASITLSRNPWTCNCDTWAFRNWLIQYNDSVLDINEVRCGSQEAFYLRNKVIISLTKADLCSMLPSIFMLSGCSLLLVTACLISFCWRHSLAAFFYSCGCRCLKKMQLHDYPYDAFLMYSEVDEDIAVGELARGLENRRQPYLLCIPTRDIPSPRTQQKVNAYLPQCTKVIVLLTRQFIENKDCLHLLVSAMSVSTESNSRCIIFVIYGDLPHTSELDPVLRTLLRSCTCLKWGQCLFWQKLIYQLPKKENRSQVFDDDEEPLIG